MDIAFLSYYSGAVDRGMETVVRELAKRLACNHQVTVYQAGHNSSKMDYAIKLIPVLLPKKNRNPTALISKIFLDPHSLAIAKFSLKVLQSFIKNKPDIIFVCNGGWQSLLVKFYCLFNKSKMVISGQAGIGWDDKWNLMLRPDLFIALSARNEKWAKKQAKNSKIVRIPNGVDLQHFRPDGVKLDLKLRKPIILCVAGPDKFKRVKDSIDAIKLLDKGSLLLVRQNVENDPDVSYGKQMLGDNFSCRQYDYAQMPAIYRSCNIFTLVSESSEAFGISYLEALASNLPVVATDDELRREIVGEAGLYLKQDIEVSAYAKLLDKALSMDWQDKPITQAKKFSWDDIVLDYENNFAKL